MQIEKRYQIFYSTSGEDTRQERLMLTSTLSMMSFFSWGLEQRTPLSSNLVRRQIDECDYVVLLIGAKYGEQSVTGESYMHLEYKYAMTRNKPIIVFMAKNPELKEFALRESRPELLERFNEFCDELKQKHDVIYYQNLRDLEMNIRNYIPRYIEKNPQEGWIRFNHIEKLKQRIKELEELVDSQKQDKKTLSHVSTVIPTQETYSFSHLPRVALLNDVAIDYRIHAYQDGNFSDVHLVRHLTWLQLIELFGQYFLEPAPEDLFNKCVNDYLNETSLAEVQMKYPRVHAVARAQVNLKTLKMIKEQLHHHEWFEPIGREDGKNRILWKITALGKQYYNG